MNTCDVPQAVYGRDALAKAIYHRLFAWVVGKINETIKVCVQGLLLKLRFKNCLR